MQSVEIEQKLIWTPNINQYANNIEAKQILPADSSVAVISNPKDTPEPKS